MSDWADLEANTLAHPILGVVRQGIKSKADGVIPPDNGPMISFEEWASRLIARTLREAYERGAADMRERAAGVADRVAGVKGDAGDALVHNVIQPTWRAASETIATAIRATPHHQGARRAMSDVCQAGYKLPPRGPCPHCGQDQDGVCGKLPTIQAAEITRLTAQVAELQASLEAVTRERDTVLAREAAMIERYDAKLDAAERERDEARAAWTSIRRAATPRPLRCSRR